MDRHKIHRICVELITTVTELAEACEIVDPADFCKKAAKN